MVESDFEVLGDDLDKKRAEDFKEAEAKGSSYNEFKNKFGSVKWQEETLAGFLDELQSEAPEDQVEDTTSVWVTELGKVSRPEVLEILLGDPDEVNGRFDQITEEFIEDCHRQKTFWRQHDRQRGQRRHVALENYSVLETDDKVYEAVVNGLFAKIETVADEILVLPFKTRFSAASYHTGYRLATEQLAA